MSTLHRASGRWRLGLSLTLLTALCWATLPIALKITLEQLDPITLTWFRFAVAALGVGGWLALRGGSPGSQGWDAGMRRCSRPPGFCWSATSLLSARRAGHHAGQCAGC